MDQEKGSKKTLINHVGMKRGHIKLDSITIKRDIEYNEQLYANAFDDISVCVLGRQEGVGL